VTQPDVVAMLEARRGGFNETLGLHFVAASPAEVVGEIVIGPQHVQPYGIVHGGVYASMAETLASTGAAITVMPEGKHAVGLENTTSFLRACRAPATLRGTARPLSPGRRSHVWEVAIHDDRGRLVAHGRVRMMILEAESELAGERVDVSRG